MSRIGNGERDLPCVFPQLQPWTDLPVDKVCRPPDQIGSNAPMYVYNGCGGAERIGKSRTSHGRMTGHGPRAAELFRVSLLDQGGPPTAGRARWRPWAAAAPCLRHRSGGPHPLSAQPCRGEQSDQEATRPLREPGPGRPRPSEAAPSDQSALLSRWTSKQQAGPWARPFVGNAQAEKGSRAVTNGGSVAEAGGGLLETHVTGARSTHPPPWLTFGGAGQNWDADNRTSTVTLSNWTAGYLGCSRTRVRARRAPRYHRHRVPDQGFQDRTTPDRCPG